MAIQLAVVLDNGHSYNYWKIDRIIAQRQQGGADPWANPTGFEVIAIYKLYRNAAAFGAGEAADASFAIEVSFDDAAVTETAFSGEVLIDNSVIALAEAFTVRGAAFSTNTGTQVA